MRALASLAWPRFGLGRPPGPPPGLCRKGNPSAVGPEHVPLDFPPTVPPRLGTHICAWGAGARGRPGRVFRLPGRGICASLQSFT